MPKLEELRNKIAITLPKSGAKIEIWDSFSALDVEKINRYIIKFDDPGIVFPVSLLIVNWDFTEDGGSKVRITKEAVERLHMEDLYTILTEAKMDKDFLELGEQDGDSPTGKEQK